MGLPFARGKKARAPAAGEEVTVLPAPAAPIASGSEAEAALDTLGAILRVFGTSSFDVAELDATGVRRLFERWSQHVLVAAPLGTETSGDQPSRRDWTGLRQLVSSHRKREAEYVVTSLANLRNAVWAFVEIVNRAAAQDRQDGALARERLTSLRQALECKDIGTLRREVSRTATDLENALSEQQKKQAQRIAEFAANIRSLGQQLETAKRQGAIDALTRLPNRSCFDEFLGRAVKLASLVGRSVGLMMVDVDQFKTINDTLGHQAGDEALKTVADFLARRFPRRGDLVARYGGDEFAVVLGDAQPADIRSLAQRLVESMRSTRVVHGGRTMRVTLSVGVAFFVIGDTAESWLFRADAALYQAKAAGRDRWVESKSDTTAR